MKTHRHLRFLLLTLTGLWLSCSAALAAADIAVTLSGMKVNDQGAADFGLVANGQTKTLTFTITNPGDTTLTLSGVTVDGTDAARFTAGSFGSSSVAAGVTTLP